MTTPAQLVTAWDVTNALPEDPAPPMAHAWPAVCELDTSHVHPACGLILARVAQAWIPACADELITSSENGYATATPILQGRL